MDSGATIKGTVAADGTIRLGRPMMRRVAPRRAGRCRSRLPAEAATRIKDIVSVQGVRANQLVGYGLVIGLNGTGDSLRNSPFTEQSLQSMLDRMGINVRNSKARTRNVAAVIVTADLPAFVGKGARIDVTVSSLGDATSLAGGSLILTPLMGADNQIYAVAQGPLAVAGFAARRQGGDGDPGRADDGAHPQRRPGRARGTRSFRRREDAGARAAQSGFQDRREHRRRHQRLSPSSATACAWRARTTCAPCRSTAPFFVNPARFMAEIGELLVETDVPARVVIDERTGTIVIGKDVQISTVAVAHGNLTVRVTETPQGLAAVAVLEGRDRRHAGDHRHRRSGRRQLRHRPRHQPADAGGGLNRIGLKPNGIIAILQAIKSAGALQADLVVQ